MEGIVGMVKDIIIFYYLPISIFISYCCCIIITTIIYIIKKNKIIVPVLVLCIALTLASLIYVYPLYRCIVIPHYVFAIVIIFIGIYCLLVAQSPCGDSISYFHSNMYPVIGKSIIIVFIIIYSNNDYDHQRVIIPGVDLILSSSILFVKPHDSTCFRIHFPYRESFLILILIIIGHSMLIIESCEMKFSLLVFAALSLSIISFIAKFLISLCINNSQDYIKINDELLYTTEKYKALIKIIKEHVNEYYHSPIDRYTIALQCEMHPDYISKVFKSEEGITINKYIQIVRLEKARYLLLNSDKKIIEVAFDVGYENLATFYRHFVKHFKKSPQQIRKEQPT
ncbi:MAG: AraC family transcriptional regulator [Spirochaetota bacterium]